MAADRPPTEKPTLDKDLEKFTFIELATRFVLRQAVAPGLGLLFLMVAALVATLSVTGNPLAAAIIAAAVLAAYMAMNIGANDVTNNVGAAVGSRALTLASALVLAAIFEIAGAMMAGGEVVATIKSGIIPPDAFGDPDRLIIVMLSSLMAAALWINIATWFNAPVSTTHSIVGAILGGAMAVLGPAALDWSLLGRIALAWIVSPLFGALIAAAFLWLIKDRIVYAEDKIAGARTWVPALLAAMTGSFTGFLMLEVFGRWLGLALPGSLGVGLAVGLISLAWFRVRIGAVADGLENRNQSVKILFRWPLVVAACLLSFAHGANDVANAIGPLAAIVEAAGIRSLATNLDAPFWVTMIGGLGISVGLLLFGPRLIRVVGEQITRLNPMRAFCVSISAAITVIIASALGLPVSSTHVAVGAVFGVGLFREWYTAHSHRRRLYVEARAARAALALTETASNGTEAAPPQGTAPAPDDDAADWAEDEAGESAASRYRYLVRRSHLMTITAAWLITVPLSGALSAIITLLLASLSS